MSLGAFLKILMGGKAVLDGLQGLAEVAERTKVGARQVRDGARQLVSSVEEEGGFTVTRDRVSNIEDRVQKIIRLVRKGKRSPTVQLAVAKVLNRKCGEKWCIPPKHHKREIKAIFDYIKSRARYMSDPREVDVFRAPERTLRDYGGGDCDDLGAALAAALEAAGYHTKMRVVAVKPDAPDQYSHILVLVGLPQRNPTMWIPLDPSVEKPAGWYPEDRISGHRDFDVPA